VGRAVNGWLTEWKAGEISKQDALELAKKSFQTNGCPLSWVAKVQDSNGNYNPRRSAFWRVIKRIRAKIDRDNCDPKWSSKLAWTNLYKIAPSRGGNPSPKLTRLQLEYCIEMLRLEVSCLSPKRILFLTGNNWAEPFIGDVQKQNQSCEIDSLDFKYVDVILKIPNLVIVVAKHPQGKPEEKYVCEVMKAFSLG
jgi:hypothetical protein